MSQNEFTHAAIVIGAGIAGLTAAAESARLGHKTALVDDGYLGGLITNIGALEGAPELEGQSGPDLVNALLGEALEAEVDYQMGAVPELVQADGGWRLPDLDISAPNVVLATGAQLRRLGVPGEERLTGLGVSQCAFCDGGLYRGKNVVVVGGGDGAFQEALHLAEMCGAVTMLLRGDAPRAQNTYVQKVAALEVIQIRQNVQVQEIMGESGVDAIRILDRATGGEETLAIDAIFPFIGLIPQTGLAPVSAARDQNGALVVNNAMLTDQAGLYAIGAARAGNGGQISDASADAKAAARAIHDTSAGA